MTFTKKGQQRILMRCPVLNCNVQEHELKRHLLRKKHRWSEEEANSHVSFCTRYFKYVTKFVKDGVMIPRFCTECNSFFGRMDHHLSINHKLDKSDDKYATLLNHSRDETERFLNAPLDSNRFNYKTTKDFKFKKGNAFLQWSKNLLRVLFLGLVWYFHTNCLALSIFLSIVLRIFHFQRIKLITVEC